MIDQELEESEDFGSYLKHTRIKYGISQRFLSRESGVTRANISKIENHKAGDVLLSTAIKLSNVLNLGIFLKHSPKP